MREASDAAAALRTTLAAARAAFAAELPRRLREIQSLGERVVGARSPADIAHLERRLHSLAGTAGLMGHAAVGAAARRAECALGDAVAGRRDWASLGAELDSLQACGGEP